MAPKKVNARNEDEVWNNVYAKCLKAKQNDKTQAESGWSRHKHRVFK